MLLHKFNLICILNLMHLQTFPTHLINLLIFITFELTITHKFNSHATLFNWSAALNIVKYMKQFTNNIKLGFLIEFVNIQKQMNKGIWMFTYI